MSEPTTNHAERPSWHSIPSEDAIASVDSDAEVGLDETEARARLERFGPNALPEPSRRSLLAVFLGQFKNPLIYLLFVAAAVALAMRHASDAVVIFVVVLLNAVVGAFQEGRAERSLAALRKLATHRARVVRAGSHRLVEAREVVPGDLLLLEAGDAVAADARLLDGAALQLAEAALTGESMPVTKALAPVSPSTPLAERQNMVYAGTHVTAGRARALVVSTGLDTEIGHIATLAESAVEPATPLEKRVDQFGRALMFLSLGVFVVVVAIGWIRALPFGEILMIAISQVVGMVPEGLPVAMTIALAVGVQRMAKRRAVVRHLSSVETMGCTTVICTDKTGTLTRNEMTVTAIHLPSGRELAVTGAGYSPEGAVLEDGKELDALRDTDVHALASAAALCVDAKLLGPDDEHPQFRPLGDPTEVALVSLAVKVGLVPDELSATAPRRAEIPFDSDAKMMATQHASGKHSFVVIKGAPEELLDRCGHARVGGRDVPFDEALRRRMIAAAESMANRALRVIAVGRVDDAEISGSAGFDAFTDRIVLLGLLGQIDPPRAEVRLAVERARAAGIRPVMVTGDHKATGRVIAETLGIARPGDEVVEGRELETMSTADLAARIDRVAVFARVHPAQKLRIVEAFQTRGEVVAMTGDGVNDAPALVKANVGIAMGITGTEVAKEASDVVIGDDDFATIVAAVEEGRVVYRNIKKAVLLLFATSAAEVVMLLLALILGFPPPFAAVQILWNNLVTEGLVTVNLMMEPPEGDEMKSPPIATDEPLITRLMRARMATMVPSIALTTLGWFAARLAMGVPTDVVRTETFTLLAICEWYNVLNCRSETHSAFDASLLANRWLLGGLVAGNLLQVAVVFFRPLGDIFHTTPIGIREIFLLGAVGSVVLWVEEIRKLLVRRRATRLATAVPT